MSTRKESGEITSDREEILKSCTDFYKSFYTQTSPTQEGTMKSNQDTEEMLEFREELERAIKRIKRHKAQVMAGILFDIKLEGGGGGGTNLTYLNKQHLQ